MMDDVEEWRQVPGYPDYEVSDWGRVRSWKRSAKNIPPPRVLTPKRLNSYGHRFFETWEAGRRQKHSIHRMVLTLFCREPVGNELALHINGIPDDNHVSNLYWGSHKNNSRDMVQAGHSQRGEKNVKAILSKRDVELIDRMLLYLTQDQIADIFGVSQPTIATITGGRNWRYAT